MQLERVEKIQTSYLIVADGLEVFTLLFKLEAGAPDQSR